MGKRRLFVHQLASTHVAAETIVNDRGIALVQSGVPLSPSVIRRLHEAGIQRVFVVDPAYKGIDVREGLAPTTFRRLYAYLSQLVEAVSKQGEVPKAAESELVQWGHTICDDLDRVPASFLPYTPYGNDPLERFLCHIIDVALLSAATMMRLKARDQAGWMATASLLQKLGIWCLDEERRRRIIAGCFDDPKLLRAQAVETQRLCRQMTVVSPFVKAICVQHLERLDGSGFPDGRQGDQIHPLARVMALVDTYVTLLRREEEPLLPHEAVEALMAGVGAEFDQTAFKAFQNGVSAYPVGTEVRLTTGEIGVVVKLRNVLNLRPVVRVLRDGDGQNVPPYDIDLAHESTRFIAQVLN